MRGLTDIAQCSRGGTAVVVSHDAVNRQLLVAFDAELGDPGTLPQDNGCFNTLGLRGEPPGVTIAAAACMFQRGRSAALSASLVAGQASCRDASGLIRECLARRR